MPSTISFIIPAHNEAFEIVSTLRAIFTAAQAVGKTFDVVVVNDDSTDQTAALAREAGAQIIDVKLRKISAVRNAGARASTGDVLFFVDADTRISEAILRAALKAIESGAVGGGAWVEFGDRVGWSTRIAVHVFSFFYMRLLNWAAGCFVYARRAAFDAVGGFDESLYACEEIVFSRALKRQGRFVVLREAVATSGRKLRMYSPLQIFPLLFRFLRYGPSLFRQRKGLDWWYEGKRERGEPRQG